MATAVYRLRGKNSVGSAVSMDFATDDGTSDANAKTVGQSFATLMGCVVQVFKSDGTLINSYTVGSQASTVNCANGVTTVSAI